ncbi:MAG: HAMP domain-containing histidine kinase [Variovorax sp.]|nr:HAMP domain-containing histidine kinase [Variovorax sp.]
MLERLRLRSLRGRLLLWLVALHVVAIAATVWFSYGAYGRLVNNFMDDQMRLLAESRATHHRAPPLQTVTGDDVIRRGAFVVQVWSADGSVLLGTSWPGVQLPLQGESGFSDVRLGPRREDAWRVFTAEPGPGDDLPRVQVVQNDGFRQSRIVRRALFESLPIFLMLPVTLLMLLLIVSAASRSLRAVARDVAAQEEEGEGGDGAEVATARVPDEIAPLVGAFNSLLGRLRQALATQRRFMQDAAHELRTPMAAIRLQIENLRGHVPAGDAAERFAQLEGGVERAQHLIEQLLRLSRQEAPRPEARGPVDVAALLRESVGQLMVLADQRRVDVGFEGRVAARVWAPASELRSVFDNLIDNAVRYAREGGVVDVRLHCVDGEPVVDVLDDGPGIPPDQIERVFDRFFRVTGAPAGGSGLGLAIARTAARRNGLRIVLSNRGDGPGLRARVVLPRSS